jgi:hypothetical protein
VRGVGLICGVLFVLMGMGHWQQDHNWGWLAASIAVALFTLVSAFQRGK